MVRCEDPLRAEVERLRTELCMREAEYDELMCQRRPAVMAEYMLAIGHLELRLYRLRCDCARLARRIDMLRAALNRGDAPDTEAIDAASTRSSRSSRRRSARWSGSSTTR